MNVQTTKPGAQKTHLTKGFKCAWDLSKKNGCHIKDLKECQLPVFEESLNSHIDDPEYNCDFEEAVIGNFLPIDHCLVIFFRNGKYFFIYFGTEYEFGTLQQSMCES